MNESNSSKLKINQSVYSNIVENSEELDLPAIEKISQKEFTLINLKKDAEDRAKAEKQVEKLDKNAISALKKA